MIRDTMERLILEEGVDTVKQFMKEAIEDGRRAFKHRVRSLLVPGRYRSAGFTEARYGNKPQMPKRARRDLIIHGAYEPVVGRRRPLHHRSARLLRVGLALVQRHARRAAGHAVDPVHADADLQRQDQRRRLLRHRAEAHAGQLGQSRRRAVLVVIPVVCRCPAPPRATCGRSRARCRAAATSRRSSAPTPCPANVAQGGGIDQYGQVSGTTNFEIGAQGQGGKYVLDGLDYGAAVFNPEGDMGDIEMWELVSR